MAQISLLSTSASETHAIGRRLARGLQAGDVILLDGDLGSGKTTLTQGIAAGLDIVSPVPSPTFTLVNEYDGRLRLYHLDLYRLSGVGDLAGLGYEEYLEPNDGVSVIEWPERAGTLLPERFLLVALHIEPDDCRRLRFAPFGDAAFATRWIEFLEADGTA